MTPRKRSTVTALAAGCVALGMLVAQRLIRGGPMTWAETGVITGITGLAATGLAYLLVVPAFGFLEKKAMLNIVSVLVVGLFEGLPPRYILASLRGMAGGHFDSDLDWMAFATGFTVPGVVIAWLVWRKCRTATKDQKQPTRR